MGRDLLEGTTYIGYAAIFLILFGLKKHYTKETKFWLLLGGLTFVFSLGPALYFYGPVQVIIDDIPIRVLLPYALFLNAPYLSLLRAPARLSIAVQLSVAILATYGLNNLAKSWVGLRRIGLYTGLSLVILAESLFQFPFPIDTTLTPPAIYTQIAQEKNALAVLEIPMRRTTKSSLTGSKRISLVPIYRLMYYATVHQHPLVGGEAARTPSTLSNFLDTAPFIRELMYPGDGDDDVTDILTINPDDIPRRGAELLANYKIGYVVIHRDLLEGYVDESLLHLPETLLQQALGDPFYDDGNIVGFRVPSDYTASLPDHETIIFGHGWFPKGINLYDRPTRWMEQSGSLLIDEPAPALRRLSLTLFAPMANYVTATLILNDRPIQALPIAPTPGEPETHLTQALALAAGLNEVKLEIEPVGPPEGQLEPRIYLGAYQISLLPTLTATEVNPTHLQVTNLAEQVQFLGYDQNTQTLQPGGRLDLTLYWQALTQLDDSYKVFVHMIDQGGNRVVQQDKIPQDWALPTTAWGPGEVVVDPYQVPLPADLSPGSYQIQIGMYSEQTGQRLSVHAAGASSQSDAISLGRITVVK
jgi:hypothetical protein